ncbi:MAG: 50S ribosomal protein L30e [Thermoplasmata archaeon]|nr:50S ribosomal protein L30e [Thermoplasmata archaeon]
MDLNKALRTATKTGRVLFGVAEARKSIEKKQGKLVVLASNCPDSELREQKVVRVLDFHGNNRELGAACGKPFSTSVVTILDPGDSKILGQ